jgi:hypothetical protein
MEGAGRYFDLTPEGPTLVNERVQQQRRGLVFFSFENFGRVLGL